MSSRLVRGIGLGVALLAAAEAGAVMPLELSESWQFRGVQEFVPVPAEVDPFCAHITNTLGRIGVRQLMIRFAYHYEFKSHPECRQGNALSEAQVRQIRTACEAAGIELIPGMNLFGHQHKEGGTFGMVGAHPEFSEARGTTNESPHTRCLCARNKEANRMAADLLSELAGVCGAKRVHIGCDEVDAIGLCDLCKGAPMAELYAEWVNGLARGLKKRGLGVMMWGDMMLDTRDYWEDDMKEESYDMRSQESIGAIDLIDRDITICDWQYYAKREYRSFERFAKRGFKVIVCPWNYRGTKAAETLFAFAKKHDHGQILGFLLTAWHDGSVVRKSYDGHVHEGPDFNERYRSASCDYVRTLQLLFPKAAATAHGGWTWWNAAEDPLDPIEGKAYEPRKAIHYFYDRLPVAHSNEIPKDVWELQKHTAGEVLRFKTGSDRLRLLYKPRFRELSDWNMATIGSSGLDVYQFEDGKWTFRAPPFPAPILAKGCDYTWEIVPNQPTLVYLPLYNGVERLVVGVRAPHDLEPLGPHASGVTKPVVIYGTSTTQGGSVNRPGLCWTSIAGREADVPVVNLGFSGSGRMEDVLCTCLIEADASLYVLDTVGNMGVPLMKERYEKFVRRLHAAKPDVPIALTVNLWPVEVAGTGAARRGTCGWGDRNAFVRALYAKLKAEDPKLWKDLHLLGDDPKTIVPDAEGTVDGYHLNDIGSMRFGTYMGARIREILVRK